MRARGIRKRNNKTNKKTTKNKNKNKDNTNTRKGEKEKVMMKRMFVIYGKQDSGKTHTARLVLAHLLENGAEFDHLDNQSSSHRVTVTELLSHPERIGDVCAFVRYNGKLIMVLSAGDKLSSFRKRMEFAQENGVDIVVCCARSRNNPNSVYREILDVYQNQQHLLTDDDWFWIEKVDKNSAWLDNRNQVAEKIVGKLLEYNISKL